MNKETFISVKGEDDAMILRKMCYAKIANVFMDGFTKENKNELEYELNIIIKNGYQSLYLIADRIVSKIKSLGYEHVTRGFIGNSIVSYILGITDFDPISNNLYYEMLADEKSKRKIKIDLVIADEIFEKILEFVNDNYVANRTLVCQRKREAKNEIEEKINFPMVFSYLEYGEIRIFKSKRLTLLHNLECTTKKSSSNVAYYDEETIDFICNTKKENITLKDIPEFGTKLGVDIITKAKPENMLDLINIVSLMHGSGTWNCGKEKSTSNAEMLIVKENRKLYEVISNREDMMADLMINGIGRSTAYEIVQFVKDGEAYNSKLLNIKSIENEMTEDEQHTIDAWNKYKEIMKCHSVPDWYIESCEKIRYLFPKGHAIEYTKIAFKIAWYKLNYPEIFEKIILGGNNYDEGIRSL